MHQYWTLNDKPKNFWEAARKGMFKFNPYDVSFHANSIAEGKDSILYFMKSKNHPTVKYELDWYNGIGTKENGEQYQLTREELKRQQEFRKRYRLDGSGEDYKYVPF